MTWLSYVFLAATVTGFAEYGHTQHSPLAPWQEVASDPYVLLVNETNDTLPVAVLARKVDHAVRFLGWVTARDSVMVRLPYADTKVTLLVGGQWFEFDVKGPTITRLVYRLQGAKP